MTLLTPPIGMSTPDVYRAWDELDGPAGENGNDLEAAAEELGSLKVLTAHSPTAEPRR